MNYKIIEISYSSPEKIDLTRKKHQPYQKINTEN